MAYDESKNKILASATNGEGLEISFNSYDGAVPKLQIGPRSFETKSGNVTYGKVGRLTIEETIWLSKMIPEMLAELPILKVEKQIKEEAKTHKSGRKAA